MLLPATQSPIFGCKNRLFALLMTPKNLADNAVLLWCKSSQEWFLPRRGKQHTIENLCPNAVLYSRYFQF